MGMTIKTRSLYKPKKTARMATPNAHQAFDVPNSSILNNGCKSAAAFNDNRSVAEKDGVTDAVNVNTLVLVCLVVEVTNRVALARIVLGVKAVVVTATVLVLVCVERTVLVKRRVLVRVRVEVVLTTQVF